jgi:murein DD-endopeptidase MepM/ murein hydrolase activator NlpD
MGIGRSRFAWLLALAVLAVGVGLGAGYVATRNPAPTASPRADLAVASITPRGSGTPGASPASTAGATARPAPPASPRRPSNVVATGPTPTSTGGPASPTASAGPVGSAASASAAPTSPAKFDPRHTVVPMAFPLPATVPHHAQALWREFRLGVVYPYNQISGVAKNGTLLRAHDGVDLTAKIGTPVLAPFAGTIVNPAAIWKPWDPERYGNVVVVRSSEATSKGYFAILVHLSTKAVKVGDRVTRGQIVGKSGLTGNAAGTVPHLHVELRAPFKIVFHYAGVKRLLDNFDPLPSLKAADPGLR